MDIRASIRQFIRTGMEEGRLIDSLGDDDSLVDAGILDSLSVLNLLCFISDEFGITPDADDLDTMDFRTVALLEKFIMDRLSRMPERRAVEGLSRNAPDR